MLTSRDAAISAVRENRARAALTSLGILFGVAPADPLVFVSVPVLLIVACLAASLVPALRASAVNPVEALRRE